MSSRGALSYESEQGAAARGEGALVDSEPEGSKGGEGRRSRLLIGVFMTPRGGEDPTPLASGKDSEVGGRSIQHA